MRRQTIKHLAVVVLLFSLAVWTHRGWAEAQTEAAPAHRVATIDMLSLLEDMLQTDTFKPDRDQFRDGWAQRIQGLEDQLSQIENELRLATPTDPNVQQLQQKYQQTGYQYQQTQQQASMEFNRYSADQAATAYSTLYQEAAAMAKELGYSHLVASRRDGEIADRGNLATVTQEILARTMIVAPEADDLTDRLREKLAIPHRPAPEAAQDVTAPAEEAPKNDLND
ncbi:MAG: hypothetical protein H6810_02820 [Phycisphaeraceae bacterium]|nr:MAG: hypothetical protein H6810_02820 [Phycisphaeraceae bacterium]